MSSQQGYAVSLGPGKLLVAVGILQYSRSVTSSPCVMWCPPHLCLYPQFPPDLRTRDRDGLILAVRFSRKDWVSKLTLSPEFPPGLRGLRFLLV